MAAVDPEILICRQHDGIRKRLCHANEASIGEAHRNVCILFDQSHNRLDVFRKFEINQ